MTRPFVPVNREDIGALVAPQARAASGRRGRLVDGHRLWGVLARDAAGGAGVLRAVGLGGEGAGDAVVESRRRHAFARVWHDGGAAPRCGPVGDAAGGAGLLASDIAGKAAVHASGSSVGAPHRVVSQHLGEVRDCCVVFYY